MSNIFCQYLTIYCLVCRVKSGTLWQQSRKDVRHSGDNVDHDKLSNSNCCRFVAKTGDKVDRIGNSRLYRQCVPGFSAISWRHNFNIVSGVTRRYVGCGAGRTRGTCQRLQMGENCKKNTRTNLDCTSSCLPEKNKKLSYR